MLVDGKGARVTSFGDGGFVAIAENPAYATCSREADGGFYVANVDEEAGLGAVELSAAGAVLATAPRRAGTVALPRGIRRGPSGHFVLLSRFDTEEIGKIHLVVRVER